MEHIYDELNSDIFPKCFSNDVKKFYGVKIVQVLNKKIIDVHMY